MILVISFGRIVVVRAMGAREQGSCTSRCADGWLFDGAAGVKTELRTTAKRRAIFKAPGRVGEVSAEPDQPSRLSIHRNPRANSAVAATILESVNDLAYGLPGGY